MRSKEEAHDYRYFPDPDLLPLEISQEFIDEVTADLPELPDEKKARYLSEFGLSAYLAEVLTAEKERADYFEAMVASGAEPKAAANWLVNEYLGRLRKFPMPVPILASPEATFTHSSLTTPSASVDVVVPVQGVSLFLTLGPTTPSSNSAIVQMLSSGEISGIVAKEVLGHIIENPSVDPRKYVEEQGLKQVTDLGAIEKVVDEIVAANPDKVEQAKAKPAMIGWFVGQVMKASGGKANPQAVNDLLKAKLGL